MENLETWQVGIDNDYLVGLVLSGKKTATTSIQDEKDIPKVNEESILLFESKKKACVLKTKKVIITEFKNINEELSNLEGEGTFDEWRKSHIKIFESIDSNFNENTKVVFEIFKVIKRF